MNLVSPEGFVLGLLLLGLSSFDSQAQTTVSISAMDDQAAESWPGQPVNPGVVRISRTGSTAAPLVVWIKVGGTARINADYVPEGGLGGSVILPAGRAYIDIPLIPVDDRIIEPAEVIRIDLETEASNGSPVPYHIDEQDRAEVDLLDNDSLSPPARISIAAISSASEGESGAPTPGVFRITRSGDASAALTVAYTAQGSATVGVDYATLSGSVVVPAGETFADVTVMPLEDTELEGDEFVTVTLLPPVCPSGFPPPPSCYAFGESITADLQILDNEMPPERAVVTVEAISEAREVSGAAPAPGAFRFTRTANLDVALTVRYSVGGTAVPGVDYTALSGSVAIPVGVTSVEVHVNPMDDTVLESGETVSLTLLSSGCPEAYPPAECYLIDGDGVASVSILDDEIAPVAVVTASQDPSITGLPGAGLGFLTAFATNGHIVSYQIKVDGALRLAGETGHTNPPAAGMPFELAFPIPTLAAGQHSVQAIVTDNLGNSGVGTTMLSITNIPPPPTRMEFIVLDSEATETRAGEPPDTATIRFTLTGSLDLGIWDFGFVGTARQGLDYVTRTVSSSLTTNGNIVTWTHDTEIAPVDDPFVEGSETVQMQMCFVVIAWVYGVGAPIGTECTGNTPGLNAVITIRDNDVVSPHPVLRLTASDAEAEEVSPLSGDVPNPGAFRIDRLGPATNEIAVQYTLTGSAQNGVDYAAIGTTAVIPEGAESITIPVLPLFEHLVEGTEAVTLTLRSPAVEPLYLLDPGLVNHATVSIKDFSPTNIPILRIKVTDSAAFEQASTSPHASFRVERSGSLLSGFSAPYSVGGTAVNGQDYVRLSGMASFPAGMRNSDITVIPYIDGETNEPDETVVITLVSPAPDVYPPPYLVAGAGTLAASAGAVLREDAPVRTRPYDRFERARRLRFPGRYRVIPLPVLPLPELPPAAPTLWAVDASSDLVGWQPIGETSDPEEFVDVDAGDAPQRFYRFREVPGTQP